MNARKKLNLVVLGLSLMTTLSIVGATTGTLAWYAYNTKVNVGYQGTSVQRTEQLQVGLVDTKTNGQWQISNSTINSYNLTIEVLTEDVKRIVWASAGGGLSQNIITEYVHNSAYKDNLLAPISSRGYAIDDDLTLYNPLMASTSVTNHDNQTGAGQKDYVKIPFAFKVLNNSGVAVGDKNIWLTQVETTPQTAGKNTHKGIRAYFENKNAGTKILMNPSSESSSVVSTRIAGVLDLNGDKYYDFDPVTMKEIVYGAFEDDELTNGHITWSNTPYVPATNPDSVDDVNHVDDETPSTFVAKHYPGVYVANYDNLEYQTAYYDTIETMKPTFNSITGLYDEDSGKPVAKTNESGIGYTDLTIYLEGWDFAVDNRIIETGFNFGMQFQINRT